jgi:hypothetical protein
MFVIAQSKNHHAANGYGVGQRLGSSQNMAGSEGKVIQ